MNPVETIDLYFKSSNDVPVTRATIKREDWEALKEYITDLELDITITQGE